MGTALVLLLLLAAIDRATLSLGKTEVNVDPPLPEGAVLSGRELLGDGGVGIASVGSVRLSGDVRNMEGVVEVQMGGKWGTVCGAGFTAKEAAVVCAQMGLTGGLVRRLQQSSRLPNLVNSLRCKGTEAALAECSYITGGACGTRPAAMACNLPAVISVRLEDDSEVSYGESRGQAAEYGGRLEVTLTGNKWGTVCDSGFGDKEAQVVCRMMGRVGGRAVKGGAYGLGTHPIMLSKVHCTGLEFNLTQCKYTTDTTGCTHAQDVAVECRDAPKMNLRLVGGKDGNQGRLEVNLGGRWGTVCRTPFITDAVAQVVCRKLTLLGGSVIRNPATKFGPTSLPIVMSKVRCGGNETELSACRFITDVRGCTHAQDVGIACTRPPVTYTRIFNSTRQGYLIVDVSTQYPSGTVCADGLKDPAARVACRKVGYYDGKVVPSRARDPVDISSSYNKLLRNLKCKGWESDLSSCSYDLNSPCKSNRSAIIKCLEASIQGIRIPGGKPSGLLEVKVKNKWGPVCNIDFGTQEATVACRQLGYTRGSVSSTRYDGPFRPAAASSVECRGTERNLNQCTYYTTQQDYDDEPCYTDGSSYSGGPVLIDCVA